MNFLDVKVLLDDDTKAIIQMQVLFEQRILYNAAKYRGRLK